MALVDVVVPAFNSEATIAASIGSILQQTMSDLRVIIINDGSTDSTRGILEQLASIHSRILLISTENRGVVDALNLGLEHCTAEFVARHDADDIAFPHRLERQLDYLRRHPECIAVANNVWHIDATGRRIGRTRFSGDARGDPYAIPAGEPYLMHPFLTLRASAMKAAGGYRHVAHCEDTDLYFRLEPLGRLHVLDDLLGEYRMHAGSITSGSVQNVRVGAVFSQLSALSARRRSAGRPDLGFSRTLALRIERAPSLEDMLDLAGAKLDESERSYLEAATAAKMLQLRVYRNFRFSMHDLKIIVGLLVRNRRIIPRRDLMILLKTPIWYYYKPRAQLLWLSDKVRSLRRGSYRIHPRTR